MVAGVAFAALAASASMKTLVRIEPLTIPAGTTAKTIAVDVHATRAKILSAAKSRQHDVTLELDVEAERSPEVFYEVWLGAPQGKRYNVGNVALYGAGIRSEARGEFHPAHVRLFVSDALALALRHASTKTLNVTFVASGKSTAALTIRKMELVAGPRQRE
jgi:hypothetical protein